MGFAFSAAVATKAFYRKKHSTDLWHFCSNCENWPVVNFDENDRNAPPSDEFCPQCLHKEREGTCEQASETQSTAPVARKKILIIDDHPDVRRVLTITLRHLGYETCEAS